LSTAKIHLNTAIDIHCISLTILVTANSDMWCSNTTFHTASRDVN